MPIGLNANMSIKDSTLTHDKHLHLHINPPYTKNYPSPYTINTCITKRIFNEKHKSENFLHKNQGLLWWHSVMNFKIFNLLPLKLGATYQIW